MLWSETDEERARKGLNQALYALRQEMGADEVFLGTQDLRLNPDLVTSDVPVHGRPRRGPTGAVPPRSTPAPSSTGSMSRTRRSSSAGWRRSGRSWRATTAPRSSSWPGAPPSAATGWGRRVVAEARRPGPAQRAGGDRADGSARLRRRPGAALQHARVYEVLVQQELEAPPDREVVALAERIRVQGGAVSVPRRLLRRSRRGPVASPGCRGRGRTELASRPRGADPPRGGLTGGAARGAALWP